MTDEATITVENEQPTTEAAPAAARSATAEANREAFKLIPVGPRGVIYENWLQIADRGKVLAAQRMSIPPWLKGNNSDAVAVVEMSIAFGFQPAQVARLTYAVNNVMGFHGQLWHAVLNKSGVLKGRLDFIYAGEGSTRTCTVTGTFKDDPEKPREYTTPPVEKIEPKNSPLWRTDPDQQLMYRALPAWMRRWCPEVMLGGYSREELLDNPPDLHQGAENAKDITPDAERILQRLKETQASAEGFDDHVAGEITNIINSNGNKKERTIARSKPRQRPQRNIEQKDNRTRNKRTESQTRSESRKTPAPTDISDNEPASAKQRVRTMQKPAQASSSVPKTPVEYARYVEAWLSTIETPNLIEQRWASEMGLRNKCGLVSEERSVIRALIDQRIKELR